jgi:hypothetical protein
MGRRVVSAASHHHPWVGFERIDFVHFRRVVVREVHAGPDAGLKDRPGRQGDDLLTNLLDGLRVPSTVTMCG